LLPSYLNNISPFLVFFKKIFAETSNQHHFYAGFSEKKEKYNSKPNHFSQSLKKAIEFLFSENIKN
jgi:hypothetical protein